TGLVRLSAAGLRVVRSVRDFRAERAEFTLGGLGADLLELLETARALESAHPEKTVPQARVGVARRAYAPLGSLSLSGLFGEAVISATGHAGVVTYLSDDKGRIFSVPGVE